VPIDVGRIVRRVPEVAERIEVVGARGGDYICPRVWESVGTMPSLASTDGMAR